MGSFVLLVIKLQSSEGLNVLEVAFIFQMCGQMEFIIFIRIKVVLKIYKIENYIRGQYYLLSTHSYFRDH